MQHTLTQYEAPSIDVFRDKVAKMKTMTLEPYL